MNNCVRSTVNGFKCFLYNVFSCLSKNLNRNIIRNKFSVNKCSKKLILCLRCSRKTYFNFLKSDFYKHLKKFNFLLKTHRLNKCLISITKINAAPYWCLFNRILFHPVVTLNRWHKITFLILFKSLHFVSSLSLF